MCAQLGVSESGFYAWRNRVPSARERDNDRLLVIIRDAYARLRGNPGVRRIHAELIALGLRVGRGRVERLMQAAGLQGRHPKAWKKTTTQGDNPVSATDLIGRDFTAEAPNEKWCGDITYIKTWQGWAYLATVIDLHSRAVVGWAVADHMRTDLVTQALTDAIARRKPPKGVIFHSDRGTQGGFNRLSQHLDRRGVACRFRLRQGQRVGGSGTRIGRSVRRCVRRGVRRCLGPASVRSGG